jgi:large repetitive protein
MTENPTVSAGANQSATTSSDGTGNCSAAIAIADATFGDNCTGSTIAYAISGASTGSGSGQVGTFTFGKGVSTITYTVTDAAGNTAVSAKTVTVTDDEAPIISCLSSPVLPRVQVRNTNTGVCTYTAVGSEFGSAATDNCGIKSLTYVLSGATTGSGTKHFRSGILNRHHKCALDCRRFIRQHEHLCVHSSGKR